MSADAPFTAPRRKLNILWWLGGLLLLVLALFLLQLFGPSPRIIVSPQTTYITEPLGPDGVPDYERYVLELYREGVTPENNAATLLWQALWPGELDPPQYAAVAKELGLTRIPSEKNLLENLYSTPTSWTTWRRPCSKRCPSISTTPSRSFTSATAKAFGSIARARTARTTAAAMSNGVFSRVNR